MFTSSDGTGLPGDEIEDIKILLVLLVHGDTLKESEVC